MSRFVVGIDVGGTTVKLGLFDTQASGSSADILRKKWEIPTRTEDDGKNILPDIAASIDSVLKEEGIPKEEVVGCGIGVPGPVDDEGCVRRAVNLGWDYFNLEEEAGRIIGIRTAGGNDADVAALGEAWKGAAEGFKSMVLVTLGTGIGGGIIINGRILNGVTGAGGEIGHIHVKDDETLQCGCGNYGCIEQYASATGIARLAQERLAENDDESLLRSNESNTAKEVFDAVKQGDKVAIEVAERFGKYLGDALSAVGCVINPDVIVIGGGVSKAGDVILGYIEKHFQKNVFHACRGARFVLASLGNDAGIYGSAKLALDRFA